jgi:hypothetical protein
MSRPAGYCEAVARPIALALKIPIPKNPPVHFNLPAFPLLKIN